ncbi:MAG TPA: ankyrin repeat domain-containing protein [Gemmatimonadales bacterium]|nr:ankyrin repeat domain-containing protein [Gemmatimonadales bacterium]
MPTVADLAAAIRERSAPRVEAILREAPALAAARPAGNPSPLLLAVYVNAPDILALLRPHVLLDACEAAAAGDVERLRALLAGDAAQVHARSGDGWTPLHLAAFFGRREALDLLLARGAPVSAVSGGQEHNQPLHAALAGACDGVIVRALVTAGADVNAAGAGGVTPLHVAASRGNAEQVRFLRTAGASVTATLDDGRTPAKLAAAHGHPTLAEELRSPV